MKKLNIKLALVALIGAVAAGFTAVKTVAADEGAASTMTVSPMNQQIILSPGESYSGVVKVTNPASSPQNLEYVALVGSFSQKNDGGDDDYDVVDTETTSQYNQIMDWITLSSESGSIAPNTTEELVYTVNVPWDAPAGGQYATIIVRDETPSTTGTGNTTIESTVQIASIIYAEVTGVTRNEGEITENSVPAIVLNNTLETASMVKNNGNVHTDASYVLQVWPAGSDEEICTNEEKPKESLIMPETEKYEIQTCKLPSMGIYKVKQTVRIFDTESVTEQTVIYCPIWMLLVVIFVIMLIIIAILAKMKKNRE